MLLHGVPTSSFLYRKVIPVLAQQGLRGLRLRLPGARARRAPRRLRLLVVGAGPLDRRGDRRARDRPLPPRRARHRRADRLRVGDPQPRARALPDRAEHDARAGRLPAALVDAPVRDPGARPRSALRTLSRFAFSEALLPPGDRRPARRAAPRGLRPLRAAQARRRRARLPADHAGLRADRGEAALSLGGHGRAPLPRADRVGRARPGAGARPDAGGSAGAEGRRPDPAPRQALPPGGPGDGRRPRRSPIWPRRWARAGVGPRVAPAPRSPPAAARRARERGSRPGRSRAAPRSPGRPRAPGRGRRGRRSARRRAPASRA